MLVDTKRLPAVFFRNDTGTEPVRDWLESLSREDRRAIGEDIKDVEYSWPRGLPLCRHLGDGLWEVRTQLHDRVARVLFCTFDGFMVLLHGFVKKSRKAPRSDLELARRRKSSLENAR